MLNKSVVRQKETPFTTTQGGFFYSIHHNPYKKIMNNTTTTPIAIDTPIYNTGSPVCSTKPSSPKLGHEGWTYKEVNPETDTPGWFNGTGISTLNSHCCWNDDKEYFQWVYPKATVKRFDAPDSLQSVYCYRTLCQRFLPLFFGIYQINGQIIQVHLREAKENHRFIYRELNIPQVTNLIWWETIRIEKKIPLNQTLARRVFNTDKFGTWNLKINLNDINKTLPPLHKTGDVYGLLTKEFNHVGRCRPARTVFTLSWGMSSTPEDAMKDFILKNENRLLPSEVFHDKLDILGYKTDSHKGRVSAINKVICEMGMKVERVRKREGGERVTYYSIESNKMENIESKF